jgi:hypothetical protein
MLRVEFHEGCEHSDPATGRPASAGPVRALPGTQDQRARLPALLVGGLAPFLVLEAIDNIDSRHQLPNAGFNHLSIAVS